MTKISEGSHYVSVVQCVTLQKTQIKLQSHLTGLSAQIIWLYLENRQIRVLST